MDASEVSLLYAAERHDISDLVLKEIGRSTKKGAAAKEMQNEIDEEMKEPILSVQEAETKQEKEDARTAKIDQLNNKRLEAKRKRDSTREARKAAQLEKRREMLEEKKRRRDSIAQARKKKDD